MKVKYLQQFVTKSLICKISKDFTSNVDKFCTIKKMFFTTKICSYLECTLMHHMTFTQVICSYFGLLQSSEQVTGSSSNFSTFIEVDQLYTAKYKTNLHCHITEGSYNQDGKNQNLQTVLRKYGFKAVTFLLLGGVILTTTIIQISRF